jgi:WD40 repeat protein
MSEFERSLAVVIGINNYQNGISQLQTAANDAAELAQILREKYNYEVWLRLDEQATLENLRKLLLETLPREIKPCECDRVLFYFAGHGTALENEDGEGPAGYLVPQDAKPGKSDTFLPMQELHNALITLSCRHLLTILDCCFAGAIRWSSNRDLLAFPEVIHKERYDRFIKDPAWQVLTSAAHDEKALDILLDNRGRGRDTNHSPFAEALFDALQGEADISPAPKDGKPAGDGIITATELYLYLREHIQSRHERQTPGLWPLKKHEKGEYIFLIPGRELDLPPAPELNEENNPYRGLKSFDEKHSHLFFGRKELIEKLYARLANPKHQLTIVLGASGSGKSSLVKAGLIPYLRNNHAQEWQILAPMRPGESPFNAIALAILPIVNHTAEGEQDSINELSQNLQRQPQKFIDIVADWSQVNPNKKLLLVIDQFEELITMCRHDSERQQFLGLLEQALAAHPQQLRIVLTLRSDFEPRFLDSPLKSYWQGDRFPVRPMRSDELRLAIEGPASEKVLYFKPANLVDQLIDEVGQMPGALPLLSFTLSELYIKCAKRFKRGETDRALTEDDYRALGGVAGSLTNRATQEYEQLDSAHQATMRRVMLRMVTIEGGGIARRRVLESELEYSNNGEDERRKQVIERLVNARLLVKGQETGEPYVEPAHDFLVRGWDKLQVWIKEEQENLALLQRLTPAAVDWHTHNRTVNYLWIRDPRLDVLKDVLTSDNPWLNRLEVEFVRESVQERKNELERTKEQLRISEERRVAAEEAQTATRLELESVTALRQFELERNLDSLLSALRTGQKLADWKNNAGNPPLHNYLSVNPLFVLQTLLDNIHEQNQLTASEDDSIWEFLGYKEVEEVDLATSDTEAEEVRRFDSPDGKHFVTLDINGRFRILELPDQLIQEPSELENNNIYKILFSPDGQIIATIGGSLYGTPTVVFWNTSGYIIGKYTAKSAYLVPELVFSPNSQQIALLEKIDGGADTQFLHFFEVLKDAGKVIQIGEGGYRGYFGRMCFTKDSKYLVTGAPGHLIRYWNLKPRLQLQSSPTGWFSGEMLLMNEEIEKIVYSSEQQSLHLIEQNDSKIKLGKGLREIVELENNPDWFEKNFLILNGKGIATVGKDGTIRFWDFSGKQLIEPKETRLENYQTENRIIFSLDGQYIAVMGNNGISIQNLLTQKITGNIAGDVYSFSNSVSFSPDGQRIATVGAERTVRIWDLRGRRLAELQLTHPQVASIIGTYFDTGDGSDPVIGFSHDGKYVVIAVGEGQNPPLFWKIEELEDLLKRGCQWLHDYLNSPKANIAEEERQLCPYIEASQT